MPLKVIGSGLGRTGTLSLKVALERLGFEKTYHMTEVIAHPDHVPVWESAGRGEPVDWEALFRGYRATVDWPGCNFEANAAPDAMASGDTKGRRRACALPCGVAVPAARAQTLDGVRSDQLVHPQNPRKVPRPG